MPKLKTIFLGGGSVLLLLVALVYFSVSREREREKNAQDTFASETAVFTLAGEIREVHAAENLFLFQDQNTGETYRVVIKDKTTFIQLVVPSGTKEGSSFVFEKQDVALKDVEAGREAFLSSSHPIERGKDIISPTEVRLLPQ